MKSYAEFKGQIPVKEETTGASLDLMGEDMSPAAFRDLNRWFEALNAKCHPLFPAYLIEKKLNFFGYTAYIENDYTIEDTEMDGQEVFILYKEYGDEIQGIDHTVEVQNAVVILDWERVNGEYYVHGRVEQVTAEEFSRIVATLDAPEENEDDTDLLDDESMITTEGKKQESHWGFWKSKPEEMKRVSDIAHKKDKDGKVITHHDGTAYNKHGRKVKVTVPVKEESELDEGVSSSIKKKINDNMTSHDDVEHHKDGHSTFRRGFYYRHGNTSEIFANRVSTELDKHGIDHEVVDHGQVDKSFKGGGSTKQNSHFWVKVKHKETVKEEIMTDNIDEKVTLNPDIPDTKEITPVKGKTNLPRTRDSEKLWKIKQSPDKTWDISSKPKLKTWKIFTEEKTTCSKCGASLKSGIHFPNCPITKKAEKAVAGVKNPELRSIALDKVRDYLANKK